MPAASTRQPNCLFWEKSYYPATQEEVERLIREAFATVSPSMSENADQ